MSYPLTYEACDPIEPLTSVDIVDYDRIRSIVEESTQIAVSAVVDYDRIQAMINLSTDTTCDCTTDTKQVLSGQLTQVESGLRQVMIGLEDEINENEVIITNKTKTMKLIF